MTTSKLYLQNLYEPTLTSATVASSGDVTFALSITPSYTKGFITFSPSNASQREIMYFDDVIGSTVYVKSENRGLGGTTAKAHTQGEIVAMKDVAEIFNFFSDNISNAFYVEKKGGLNVNVWGGSVFYNQAYQSFSDTALTLTASTTNYIQYDYSTNIISVSLTDGPKTKAIVVTSLTSITSITYQVAKESYIDFVVALNTALPSQTGNARKVLKTDGTNAAWGDKDDYAVDTGAANAYAIAITDATYTTGLQFAFKATNANTTTSTINVNALGVKTIKDTTGSTLGSGAIAAGAIIHCVYNGTDIIATAGLKSTSSSVGNIEIATQSEMDAGTTTGGTGASIVPTADLIQTTIKQLRTYVAGEALAANDFVYEETLNTFLTAYSTTVGSSTQGIGDVAGNTKISLRFIGNGVSASSLKMPLNKLGAPVDNCIVRIETDSAGNPSGTLVNANATSTIAGGTLSTGTSETTVTFTGAFTCTAGTVYHVVISRSGGTDGVNYYLTSLYTRNVRAFTMNKYNASWGTALTTSTLGMIFAGGYATVVCKTSAATLAQCPYIGYTSASVLVGGTTILNTKGVLANTFSGLAGLNTPYYLSNTAGLISTTPGTNVKLVGFSTSSTQLDIVPQQENASLYPAGTAYQTIFATASTFVQFYVKYPCLIIGSYTAGFVYQNQTAKTNGVVFTANSGDVISFYGTGSPTLQVSINVTGTGFFI